MNMLPALLLVSIPSTTVRALFAGQERPSKRVAEASDQMVLLLQSSPRPCLGKPQMRVLW